MAITKKSTAVAKVESGGAVAVREDVPDFMKPFLGQNLAKIDLSDIEIPRLQLLQALSPQVMGGDEKAGTFFHTIAEETIGNELKIVPVYVDIRYILWKPRHEGGGILARADDGKHWNPANAEFVVQPYKDNKKKVTWKTASTVQESGLAAWGSTDPDDPNSQPAATKMFSIVAVLPDYPELSPVLITLQRGAINVAKKFMGKIKISGVPEYAQYFAMKSEQDNSGAGDFNNYVFERAGLVRNEDEFNHYKAVHDQFAAQGLTMKDLERMQEGDSSSGVPDDEDKPIKY